MKKLNLKSITKNIIMVALFAALVASQVEAFQVCSTDIQITFKDGFNLVMGLTEGIKIW